MRCRSIALALATGLTLLFGSQVSSQATHPDQASSAPRTTVSQGVETTPVNGGVLRVDTTGKGAVLCVWGIYQAARAAGRTCHKGQDQAFQAELDRSLSRTDAFIVRNSRNRVTRADLAKRRTVGLKQLRQQGDLCTGDADRLYRAMLVGGAARLRSQTADLLSIPREPVMAPCL